MMFSRLLLLFTLVPLVELVILIKVGEVLGTMNTILLVILTGVLGAAFARSQGLGILREIRRTTEMGRVPGRELLQGFMILVGGLMLITPGFLTDLVGLSLLIPFTRKVYSNWIIAYLKRKTRSQHRYNQSDPFHRGDLDGNYDIYDWNEDDDKTEILQ